MRAAMVVVPTHAHPLLLPLALQSACAQTVEDTRIVVIGDGVGDETRDCLAPLLNADRRIEFLDLPKAGRTGEPHRHAVVRSTDTVIVTYLSDDDLLAPDHVATMRDLLGAADLAHPPNVLVTLDGAVRCEAVDLGDPGWRELELAGTSLVSLTGLAHTAEAYRRLPYGWRETPQGRYTDQHMIQQFLAQPWCRVVGGARATTLHFPGSYRTSMTSQQRSDELATWAARLATPDGWAGLRAQADISFRRNANADRRSALTCGDGLHRANLRIEDLESTVKRLEHAVNNGAELVAVATLQREAAERACDDAVRSLRVARASLDELTGELDRADEAERTASAMIADLSAAVGSLQDALAAKSEELDALVRTRTMRLRSVLIRSPLTRALLARRPGGREAIPP